MKRFCILTFSLLLSLYCFGQEIIVIFAAKGDTSVIECITALNQRTNQTVTLPGNDTVLLQQSSGLQETSIPENTIVAYPNPFSGVSKINVSLKEPQKVRLRIYNNAGKLITTFNQLLEDGLNELEISLAETGFYFLVIETNMSFESCKLVNLCSSGLPNRIQYQGVINDYIYQNGLTKAQNSKGKYSLDYVPGDIIHFTCKSGDMTTVFADTPEHSIIHYVEFTHCTDEGGRSYAVTKIGDQFWMAENLAYIATVNEPVDNPFFYVPGYEGSDLDEVKNTDYYKKYGVLYQYNKAKSSCPPGWRLPSRDEWNELINYLTDNGYGYGGTGDDVAKALAFSSGWTSWNFAESVGHDQASNNITGFGALPGGNCDRNGHFDFLGSFAFFWQRYTRSVQYYSRSINYYQGVVLGGSGNINNRNSVRCVKSK